MDLGDPRRCSATPGCGIKKAELLIAYHSSKKSKQRKKTWPQLRKIPEINGESKYVSLLHLKILKVHTTPHTVLKT